MALPADARPIRAAFPSGTLTDPVTGMVTTWWRAFFMALYARTGDVQGVDVHAVQDALVQTANALVATDTALIEQLAAEEAARQQADAAEQSARQAGDASRLPLAGGTLTGPLAGPAAAFAEVGVTVAGGPTVATWTAGTVVPAFVAAQGSLYSRQGGGVGATLYVSQGGTIWNPVAGV